MSDSSDEAPELAYKPQRKRKKLKLLTEDSLNEDSHSLTEVNSSYFKKMKEVEESNVVRKTKADLENTTLKEPSIIRNRPVIESDSEPEDENLDVGPLSMFRRKRDSPSPPRFSALKHKPAINPALSKSLAEADRRRREWQYQQLYSTRPNPPPYCCNDMSPSPPNSLKVKVRSVNHGTSRFEMKSSDSFASIYEKMAAVEKEEPDKIRLTINGSTTLIKRYETWKDHNLTIADIVECVVVKDVASTDGDLSTDDAISIKIQTNDSKAGQYSTVKVLKTNPLRQLMDAYAQSQGVELQKIRFGFDGEALDPNATPIDLDMEDGDCIDVTFLK